MNQKKLRAVIVLVMLLASILTTMPTAAYDVDTPQQSGMVVISAPSGAPVSTASTAWVDIPKMKGAVNMRGTSDMAITFCAEAFTSSGRLFLRALVDGVTSSPSDVVFAAGTFTGTQCFTFVRNGVGAGTRAVQLQWLVDGGTTGYLGDHTLTVIYAQANSEDMRLLAVAAPSGATLNAGAGWADLPNLSGVLPLTVTSDLAITISGEVYTNGGNRLFVRALIDGTVAEPSDQVLMVGGYTGTRSCTLVKKAVGPGSHNIVIQWLADSAQGYISDRTLTVVAVPTGNNIHAGALFVAAPSGPFLSTTGSWANMPNLSGDIVLPAEGELSINVSASIYAVDGSKRIFLRALVDGVPALASDVVVEIGGWRGTYAFRFVKRGLSPGSHFVQIQWTVDSGGTAYVGDRTLSAYAYASQHPIMFVAMESDRGAADYPFGGYFADSVVNTSGGGVRTFKPYVADRLWGAYPSVADYFLENSGGRFFMTYTAVLGPYKKQYNEKYYRESIPNPFVTMQTEAIVRADSDFDFSLYDRNGDGIVDHSELDIMVIFYQDSAAAGFAWVPSGVPNIVTNDGVTMDCTHVTHVYTPDFLNSGQLGLIAHELAHCFINAGDMYESVWDPTAPGMYSLMDQHVLMSHLDPFTKIHDGDWYAPITITADSYYEIAPIEEVARVYKLRDPSSHTSEYFLVENRQLISYDASLPDSGIAIWHIDESRYPDVRTAVEIEPACGPTNPIQWQNYLWDGTGSTWGRDFWDDSTGSQSHWHDGTLSRIGVWAIDASSKSMLVYFDVPGPGLLVDVKPDVAYMNSVGEATFQVRLVNTGLAADTFQLSATVAAGGRSWSENPVTLGSYEERIITLVVQPIWGAQSEINFTVTGQSITNAYVMTNHLGTVSKISPISGLYAYLPFVAR